MSVEPLSILTALEPFQGRKPVLSALLSAGLLLLSVGNVLAQGSVATDRAALEALYDATGGSSWTTSTFWKTGAPLSAWHGVTTDEDGRVTELSLVQNQLSGTISPELGDLSNLEKLWLHYNQLSGTIPPALGNLSNLTSLVLNRNQLSGTIPAALGNLTNLTSLVLDCNQLSGTIPARLGNLTNLTRLDLSENQLSGAIPATLGNLTNLTRLDLSDNQLTGEIPVELGGLTNLQWLALHSNQLTGEIPAELGGLTRLRDLWLGGNQLSGEIPTELGNLSTILMRGLGLSGNQLSGSIPAALGNLKHLLGLGLSGNQLSGSIPATLGNLSSLISLTIDTTTGLCLAPDFPLTSRFATRSGLSVCTTGGGPAGSVPGAPRNLVANGGNEQVTLTWDAPEDNGSEAVTDYEYRINRSDPWISIGSIGTTHTVTGLVNGTFYAFEVRAVNAAGRSASSNRIIAKPEVFTLDFAHFANGASITSDLVLVNVGDPSDPASPLLLR